MINLQYFSDLGSNVYNVINSHPILLAIVATIIATIIMGSCVLLYKKTHKSVKNSFMKIIDFFRSRWNRVVSAIKSIPDKFWQYVADRVSPRLKGNFDNKDSKVSVAKDIDTENQKIQDSSKDGEEYENIWKLYKNEEYGKAFGRFKTLADKGFARAQLQTGYMYGAGEGTEENLKKAIEYYKKSAKQGNIIAKSNLGIIYHVGKGVEKDFKAAVEFYNEAAKYGEQVAQNNLGALYRNGEGVLQDYILAYAWYSLSKAQGNEVAPENLDAVVKKMTKGAILQAQAKAKELEAEIKANIEAKKKEDES